MTEEEDSGCECMGEEDVCDCTDEAVCLGCNKLLPPRCPKSSPRSCAHVDLRQRVCACNQSCSAQVRPRRHVGACNLWNTNRPPRTTPRMEERFNRLLQKWSDETKAALEDQRCVCNEPWQNTRCGVVVCPPKPCARPRSRVCVRDRDRSRERTTCINIPIQEPDDNCNCLPSADPNPGLKLWKGVTLKFTIDSHGNIDSPQVVVKESPKKDGDLCICDADEAAATSGNKQMNSRPVNNRDSLTDEDCSCCENDRNPCGQEDKENGINGMREDPFVKEIHKIPPNKGGQYDPNTVRGVPVLVYGDLPQDDGSKGKGRKSSSPGPKNDTRHRGKGSVTTQGGRLGSIGELGDTRGSVVPEAVRIGSTEQHFKSGGPRNTASGGSVSGNVASGHRLVNETPHNKEGKKNSTALLKL